MSWGGQSTPPGLGIQERLVLFVSFMEWLVPPPPSKQFSYMVTPDLLKEGPTSFCDEILSFPHGVRDLRKTRKVGRGRGIWCLLGAKALRRAGMGTMSSFTPLDECVRVRV